MVRSEEFYSKRKPLECTNCGIWLTYSFNSIPPSHMVGMETGNHYIREESLDSGVRISNGMKNAVPYHHLTFCPHNKLLQGIYLLTHVFVLQLPRQVSLAWTNPCMHECSH